MSQAREILVIDTSYGLTVGVVGHEPLYEADSRSHVEKIEPFIANAISKAQLKPEQITTIVVGTGPAPFTGLRAGIVSAKALAFATGAKILGQNILEPQAHWIASHQRTNSSPQLLLSVNDARRKQLYFQLFVINQDTKSGQKISGTDTQSVGVIALGEMDIQYPHDIVQTVLQQTETAGLTEVRELTIVGHGGLKYNDAWQELGEKGFSVEVKEESVLHSDGARGLKIFAQTALDREVEGKDTSANPMYLRRPEVSLPPPLKTVTL